MSCRTQVRRVGMGIGCDSKWRSVGRQDLFDFDFASHSDDLSRVAMRLSLDLSPQAKTSSTHTRRRTAGHRQSEHHGVACLHIICGEQMSGDARGLPGVWTKGDSQTLCVYTLG